MNWGLGTKVPANCPSEKVSTLVSLSISHPAGMTSIFSFEELRFHQSGDGKCCPRTETRGKSWSLESNHDLTTYCDVGKVILYHFTLKTNHSYLTIQKGDSVRYYTQRAQDIVLLAHKADVMVCLARTHVSKVLVLSVAMLEINEF